MNSHSPPKHFNLDTEHKVLLSFIIVKKKTKHIYCAPWHHGAMATSFVSITKSVLKYENAVISGCVFFFLGKAMRCLLQFLNCAPRLQGTIDFVGLGDLGVLAVDQVVTLQEKIMPVHIIQLIVIVFRHDICY